jgi:hypothetical protein
MKARFNHNYQPFQGRNEIQEFPKERVLFAAISSLNYDLVDEILLNYKDMVNYSRKGDGFTPLHCAVYTNEEDMVNLLLKYGADPNKSCKIEGLTPLALGLKTASTKPIIIVNLIQCYGDYLYKDIELYHKQRLKIHRDVGSIEDLTSVVRVVGLPKEPTVAKKQDVTTPSKSWCEVPLQPLNLIECLSDIGCLEFPIEPGSPVSKNLLGESAEVRADDIDLTFHPENVNL